MRICMFTRAVPAHGKGGMEDQIMMQAKKIVEHGHEVTIITTEHPEGKLYEEIGGVKIQYLKNTPSRKYSRSWWHNSIKKFIELHSQEMFDIVHSQSGGGYYIFKKKINKKYRIPTVTSLYGVMYDEIKTIINLLSFKHPLELIKLLYTILRYFGFYTLFELVYIRKADDVIVTSKEQKAIIEKFYFANKNKVVIVFNGIDSNLFIPNLNSGYLLKKYKTPDNCKLLLSVARLEDDKGIQNIIYALPTIIKKIENIKLMIVGDGSYKGNLKKLVKELNLDDYVIFTGFVPFEELPYYFNACDVFINPTIRQNGYDLTIIEAMSCEKPVIVSNIGSVPTLITHEVDGILVPPGNVNKLSEEVIKALNNTAFAEELGKNARKRVINKFDTESMAKGIIEVYNSLMKNYTFSERDIFEEKYKQNYDPWSSRKLIPELHRLNVAFNIIPKKSYTRILDLGCGEGFFANRLAQLGNDIFGVDISQTAIRRTKIAFSNKSNFLVGDITNLPFDKDNLFDLITCIEVLYYTNKHERKSIIDTLHKLLTPEGIIVFSAPVTGGRYFGYDEYIDLISKRFRILKMISATSILSYPIEFRVSILPTKIRFRIHDCIMLLTRMFPRTLTHHLVVLAIKEN